MFELLEQRRKEIVKEFHDSNGYCYRSCENCRHILKLEDGDLLCKLLIEQHPGIGLSVRVLKDCSCRRWVL
jgi:hypothetical protein